MLRILDTETVNSLLTEELVLDAMRQLFELTDDPEAIGYGRLNLTHPNGWLRYLPGYIVPKGVFGFKLLHRTTDVGMRYTIYVHDLESGELVGIVDGQEITELRTGAVSAVASDHLAVEDINIAALIGTGPVARGQLRELELVRPAKETRVFARTPEHRRRFIEEMEDAVAGRLVEASSLEAAIEGADLVTLATKAREPILLSDHLAPGMHVNSVGPASLDRMEIDPSLFGVFDRVVCDSVELVTTEAGDASRAVEEGHFLPSGANDLSEIVSGGSGGRSSSDEITLFKSVGTGLQDLMVAAQLLQAALAGGIGLVVDEFVSVKPVGSRHVSAD